MGMKHVRARTSKVWAVARHQGTSPAPVGSSSLDSSTGSIEELDAPSLRALDACDVLAVPLRLGIAYESSRARSYIRTHESSGQMRCECACHMEFAASCAARDIGRAVVVEMWASLARARSGSGAFRHPRGGGPAGGEAPPRDGRAPARGGRRRCEGRGQPRPTGSAPGVTDNGAYKCRYISSSTGVGIPPPRPTHPPDSRQRTHRVVMHTDQRPSVWPLHAATT
jgi:hypothetical protein